MGGLQTVSSSHKVRVVAITVWTVGAVTLLGCDDSSKSSAAPKSRVQAVAATEKPGATEATSTEQTTQPVATTNKPRAKLCDGQLSRPADRFAPKTGVETRSAAGEQKLPPEPLGSPNSANGKPGAWQWINLWAAWCVPCKEELPLLFQWQAQLKGQVQFTFVSLDDDERQLMNFLTAQPADGLRQSYWLPDGELRKGWLEAMGFESDPELPMQLLLDPEGNLRCKVQGAVEPSDLATLQQIVRRK